MPRHILVTGGAGYIGSHTAVELIQAGFDVVIADNLSNSDLQAVEGVRRITGAEVPFEQIDCCDLQAMRRLFERHEFRYVDDKRLTVGIPAKRALLFAKNGARLY